MARRIRDRHGFTLMELMIVVAIMGILAAIAVPTFVMLMNRSKTAEASTNLNNMFKSAAAYFNAERGSKQVSGGVSVNCVVGDSGPDPAIPTKVKQRFTGTADAFKAIGFSVADFVYYSYEIHAATPTGKCGVVKNTIDLYTFTANGDLDGNGIHSTFEMATGTNDANQLYHSIGFYIDKELQ